MPTVALVLPTTSYRGPDFVSAAAELGVDLVVATDGSLGVASGRIRDVVAIDCADPSGAAAALVDRARVIPIDAVVGVDDAGVMTAALVAEQLGLPHNTPASVAATRDKLEMRRLLAAGGVPQPDFVALEEADHADAAADGVGYPLVVKPLSLSGSRGVIKVEAPSALAAAVTRVRAIQDEAGIAVEPLLIEEYVGGPEIAIEGLLSPAGLELLAMFDKPDPLDGPFFEETVYVTPSRHPEPLLSEAGRLVESAAAALGLALGPIHAEIRLGSSGPKLIEMAARSIGGLCGRSLKFGMLDQSLEVLLLRAALGMNRRGMGNLGGASGAMMIPITADGVLRAIRGREATAEVDGIEEVTITIPIGKPIRRLPEGDRYLGFIIGRGDDPADVERSLREAHGLVEIDIEESE